MTAEQRLIKRKENKSIIQKRKDDISTIKKNDFEKMGEEK